MLLSRPVAGSGSNRFEDLSLTGDGRFGTERVCSRPVGRVEPVTIESGIAWMALARFSSADCRRMIWSSLFSYCSWLRSWRLDMRSTCWRKSAMRSS